MEEPRMLRRLKAGKTDALDALIEQYNPYVCAIIRTVLGARGTTEIGTAWCVLVCISCFGASNSHTKRII